MINLIKNTNVSVVFKKQQIMQEYFCVHISNTEDVYNVLHGQAG